MGLAIIALAFASGACARQDAVFVPSPDQLVRKLESSILAEDASVRLETIAWLRSRRIPAAFDVLSRARHDPSEGVRAEALLGLAEIAPECALDAYRMRDLPPAERARLIERAVSVGLIEPLALKAIARNDALSDAERAQALLGLHRLEEPVDAELWIPLLRAEEESVRLIASLAVVSETPETRPVALVQDLAIETLRAGVRDAAGGNIAGVTGALKALQNIPIGALPDWSAALISACADHTPADRLVRREALCTLLVAQPDRPGLSRMMQAHLNAARNPDLERRVFALGALTHAVHSSWLLQHLANSDDRFVQSAHLALEQLAQQGYVSPVTIEALGASGGELGRELALELTTQLPRDERIDALRRLLIMGNDRAWDSMKALCAKTLMSIDPEIANDVLEQAIQTGRDRTSEALVLAGAWSAACESRRRLTLLRSLLKAEQTTLGRRTSERAALADRLVMIVQSEGVFAAPIRAEAAWLALVLRDQTSEAMARLPKSGPNLREESSRKDPEGDSLLRWAQMPYP